MTEQGGPSSARNSENSLGPCHWGFALRWGRRPGSPSLDANTQPHCPAESGQQDMCPKCVTERRNEGQMEEWVDDGASE